MTSSSRALAAALVAAAVLSPAAPGAAAPTQDPAPAASASAAAGQATDPATQATGAPVLAPQAGATLMPDLATKGWVVADMDSGQILAMRNPDVQMRPASTLKVLTVLTVAPRLNPEQPYRAVAADETAEGNRVVLYKDLTYKVSDLIHAALLPSANDAAEALARANGGIAPTVEQMNAEAARLGATRTTAVNPSGLDADGQFTTARDLATIGRAAFANPEIAEYLKLAVVDFPGKQTADGKRVIYPIYSQNRMLRSGFVGALGGKSGFTTKARRTFVAAAERDGRRLIVSLLDIGGNTYGTAETALNWAFRNVDRLAPVGQLPDPTAPAPQFDRAVAPLPEEGAVPTTTTALANPDSDAPTAIGRPRQWRLPSLSEPDMPAPLTLLTLFAGLIAVMRVRVYWISHRSRTAWTGLDSWAKAQARSSRRRAPADPYVPGGGAPPRRSTHAARVSAPGRASGAPGRGPVDVPARRPVGAPVRGQAPAGTVGRS